MKKVFIIFAAALVAVSCGDSSSDKKETETTSAGETTAAPPPPAEETKDPAITKGMELIAKSDCLTCHKLTETSIGPAYSAVSAKYQGRENITDSLAQKIIKGGAGVWGTVPMTPHPQLSQEDAKAMATYVMSVK
jgi:cytochrome c